MSTPSTAPWPYRKTLLIGASSGIGYALTKRIVASDSQVHVIAAARRADRLHELQAACGGEARVSIIEMDATDLSNVPLVVEGITTSHPDLDCVIFNAGIQRGLDFTNPSGINLEQFQEELIINYTAPVRYIHAFLPHFLSRAGPRAIIATTSNLAVVPAARCAGYSASKAAMHSFLIALRLQLGLAGQAATPDATDAGTGLRIVELMPPAVQTELHDAKNQPDMAGRGPFGMALDAFTEEAFARLAAGRECQVSVQSPPGFAAFEQWRGNLASQMARLTQPKRS